MKSALIVIIALMFILPNPIHKPSYRSLRAISISQALNDDDDKFDGNGQCASRVSNAAFLTFTYEIVSDAGVKLTLSHRPSGFMRRISPAKDQEEPHDA